MTIITMMMVMMMKIILAIITIIRRTQIGSVVGAFQCITMTNIILIVVF